MTSPNPALWITGAGRSGTHLMGMLLDGHPQTNVFPREFRLPEQWLALSSLGPVDANLRLPAGLVDAALRHFYRLGEGDWQAAQWVSLKETLAEVHRRGFSTIAGRMFAFHSPGSQVGFFLEQLGEQARVVISLRHPVQNYLALLAHVLQKGEGYQPQEKLHRNVNLTSMLHLNLFRVFAAFQAASRWQNDARVLVTRLEDFTTRPEERQRVWSFLGIAPDSSLEQTTRGGLASDARSGQWESSQIQPVKTDAYRDPLTETEVRALAAGAAWWSPYYPDALQGIHTRPDSEAVDVFYQREANYLLNDRHALERREARLAEVFGEPRRWLAGFVRRPGRALRTLYRERLAYPQALLKPRRQRLAKLQAGLDHVAVLVGAADGELSQ